MGGRAGGSGAPLHIELTTLFAALGDPVRMGIVTLLIAQGPLSVTQLSESFPITRQAVGKHVRVLQEAHVLELQKSGREQIARVRPESLHAASGRIAELAAEWDRRLDRLRAFVESE